MRHIRYVVRFCMPDLWGWAVFSIVFAMLSIDALEAVKQGGAINWEQAIVICLLVYSVVSLWRLVPFLLYHAYKYRHQSQCHWSDLHAHSEYDYLFSKGDIQIGFTRETSGDVLGAYVGTIISLPSDASLAVGCTKIPPDFSSFGFLILFRIVLLWLKWGVSFWVQPGPKDDSSVYRDDNDRELLSSLLRHIVRHQCLATSLKEGDIVTLPYLYGLWCVPKKYACLPCESQGQMGVENDQPLFEGADYLLLISD